MKLGDKGTAAVARELLKATAAGDGVGGVNSIKALYLGENNIGSDGATFLAEALQSGSGPRLDKLFLTDNPRICGQPGHLLLHQICQARGIQLIGLGAAPKLRPPPPPPPPPPPLPPQPTQPTQPTQPPKAPSPPPQSPPPPPETPPKPCPPRVELMPCSRAMGQHRNSGEAVARRHAPGASTTSSTLNDGRKAASWRAAVPVRPPTASHEPRFRATLALSV